MKILLVYPEMPDTLYAMNHMIKALGKKSSYPPLGLLTISSLLPNNWERKLVDLNCKPLEKRDVLWADYVFLSAMNVQEQSAREIIKFCNELGVKIVAGGPLFTHEHPRFKGVDHFVLNEGEITLPQFLKDLESNSLKKIYESKEFADVASSPLPDFSIVNFNDYLYSIVQYSRGCPYLCDFCDVTALFGRKPRTKTNQQIFDELDFLNKHTQTKLVLFADDNLIGNKRQLKSELLPALIEWRKKNKPSFFFATQLTINLADDEELMQLLIDAGFRFVFIGIETIDEESLLHSAKKQNLKRNIMDNIQKLHEFGFIIFGGFIVGFDTDSDSIFDQQIKFIQESGIPLPIVNILKAPPGTDLFKRIKNENRLVKDFAFFEGETNIKTVMDKKQLLEGFIHLTENIFSPEHSFERLKTFLSNYNRPKTDIKVKGNHSLNEVYLGLKSVYNVGIKSKSRKYFWKLIFWTFKNNKKHLDKALTFGILIHQMENTKQSIHNFVEKELAQNN